MTHRLVGSRAQSELAWARAEGLVASVSALLLAGCLSTEASQPPGASDETIDNGGSPSTEGVGGAGASPGGGSAGTTVTGTGSTMVATGGTEQIPDPPGTGGTGTGGTGNGGTDVAPTGGQGGSTTVLGGSGGAIAGGTGGSGGDGQCFDAGTAPDRNRVAAGQVCDRLATVQCAAEQCCCDAPGRTFDQCKTAQVAECQGEFFLDSVTLNSLSGYSIDAAELAFAEFENRASQCDPTIAAWAISPSGLRGMTQGSIGPGGDCTPPIGFSTETAAAYLASCTNGATQACLPGGVAGTTWTCSPLQNADDNCFSDLNCVDDHYCNNFSNPPALTGSICIARKTNGSTCAHSQECLSLTCDGGVCVTPTAQTAYCLGP